LLGDSFRPGGRDEYQTFNEKVVAEDTDNEKVLASLRGNEIFRARRCP
jgi:hypothetical protein